MNQLSGPISPQLAPPDLEFTYRASWVRLVRFGWLLCGSRELAEDLAQDAFLRLGSEDCCQPEATFPYLRKIVVNLIHDQHRRNLVAQRYSTSTPPALTDDDDLIWQLFQRLPSRQRAALVLRFYNDLSVADIAEVLDCPEGTVKSLIHRGLQLLKKELDGDD